MINTNILKIASDTKHYGLKGDYTLWQLSKMETLLKLKLK